MISLILTSCPPPPPTHTHMHKHPPTHPLLMTCSVCAQLPSGGWTQDGMAYLNVDGIFQVTRPAVQLGRIRWTEVRASCDRLMALVTGALNDEVKLLGSVSSTSHNLPALVAAVAECQKQFPDMIKSTRPWPMCLDTVPYI
jgi:hypothetical protein